MRIALVTHSLESGGGTATLTSFLYRILRDSGRYVPDVVSLATSVSDRASLLITRPGTWRRGPEIRVMTWRGQSYYHVGAIAPELEFQRYRPRRVLTDFLARWDAVQFVVGVPAWLHVAARLRQPVFLYAATTLEADRANRLRTARGVRRWWLPAMTRVARRFERLALARADFVFALSEYTKRALKATVEDSRLALAPCGVDTEAFRPLPRDARQEGYILSVGRFTDPRKNVRLLLEAYAVLCRRVPNTPRLVLVGSGLTAADERRVSTLGITDRVTCLVDVAPECLPELYRQAGLFVLSSDEEGLGIVLLEAMASGAPVIATRCGGPEMLVRDGQTGFLVDIGDIDGLAEAMRCVLEQPDHVRSVTAAARHMVEQRYSLARAGQIFLDVYADRLGARGRERRCG